MRSFLSHGAHLPRRNDLSIDDATTEALERPRHAAHHHGEETIEADWVPELPSGFPPHYEIADLLNWLNDLNPLG